MDKAQELYQAGRSAMAAGDLTKAVGLFEQSNKAAEHFKTAELLGECLLSLGKAQEAIRPLTRATELNKQGRGPSLLAKAYLTLGAHDSARRAAEEALLRTPGNRLALSVLAELKSANVRV